MNNNKLFSQVSQKHTAHIIYREAAPVCRGEDCRWDLITSEQWALCLFLPLVSWQRGPGDTGQWWDGDTSPPCVEILAYVIFTSIHIFFTTVIMIHVWDIWINTANNAFIIQFFKRNSVIMAQNFISDKLISCEAEAVCNWNVFHYSPIMRQWDTTIMSQGALHLAQ